jgi:putative Holliday junction resolvase
MALFNLTELRARLTPDERLIGLDPGTKTIGVALTDVRLTLATPYASLRRGKLRDNAAEIAAIARKEGAGGLVVGLPLSMDGTAGPAAQAARDWTLALSDATGLPASLWDERLSTAAVNRFLIGEADLSRKKRAVAVDRAAAAWMLQSALDASREERAAPPRSWSAHGSAQQAARGQAPADHPRLPGRGVSKRRGSSAFAEDDEE